MVEFDSKRWETQILSKGSTLNLPETYKKNCQSQLTNLLAKQPKTTTLRLHLTYPVV